MRTDATGVSATTRLPAGRFWAVLGSDGPSAYTVEVLWGASIVQVDNAPGGLHTSTMLPCFPDAFVQIQGQPNTLYLIAVTE